MVPALGQLRCFPLLAVPPCPSPPAIRNGHHDSRGVQEFIPGVSVKYHCQPGYVLTGKSTVSCLPPGVWSSPSPRCEGELETPALTVGAESAALTQPPKPGRSRSPSPALLLFPGSHHLQQPQHQGRRGG